MKETEEGKGLSSMVEKGRIFKSDRLIIEL